MKGAPGRSPLRAPGSLVHHSRFIIASAVEELPDSKLKSSANLGHQRDKYMEPRMVSTRNAYVMSPGPDLSEYAGRDRAVNKRVQ